MTLEELALYSKDLETTLEEHNLNKYGEFIKKWHDMGLIDDKTYFAYINAEQQTKMNSYCSLILASKKTSELAKEWAKENRKVDIVN